MTPTIEVVSLEGHDRRSIVRLVDHMLLCCSPSNPADCGAERQRFLSATTVTSAAARFRAQEAPLQHMVHGFPRDRDGRNQS
jgi:hypothetical protein